VGLDGWIAASPWPATTAWALIYFSDYRLTLAGARLYKQGADKHLRFEGSYELNPAFVEAVDALRSFDAKFVVYWATSIVIVLGWWFLGVGWFELPSAFCLLAGVLFGRELAVHARHLRNIALFRMLRSEDAAEGSICYRRWVSLRLSGLDMVLQAALFTALAAAVASWTLAGAAFGCATLGVAHLQRSRRQRRAGVGTTPPAATTAAPAAPAAPEATAGGDSA
jgi:hypothetical protein